MRKPLNLSNFVSLNAPFCYRSSSDVLRQAEGDKLNLTSVDGDDSATAADRMPPGRDSSGSSRDIDGGTAWFCVLGMCIYSSQADIIPIYGTAYILKAKINFVTSSKSTQLTTRTQNKR